VREDAKAAVKTFDAAVSGAPQATRTSLGFVVTVGDEGDASINSAEYTSV
jgi:hypothetical protein